MSSNKTVEFLQNIWKAALQHIRTNLLVLYKIDLHPTQTTF